MPLETAWRYLDYALASYEGWKDRIGLLLGMVSSLATWESRALLQSMGKHTKIANSINMNYTQWLSCSMCQT